MRVFLIMAFLVRVIANSANGPLPLRVPVAVSFRADDLQFLRGIDAQPDVLATNVRDHDRDVVSDLDRLSDRSAQDQHPCVSFALPALKYSSPTGPRISQIIHQAPSRTLDNRGA